MTGLAPDVLEVVNRARLARGEEPLQDGPSFGDASSAEDLALFERIADETITGPRTTMKGDR